MCFFFPLKKNQKDAAHFICPLISMRPLWCRIGEVQTGSLLPPPPVCCYAMFFSFNTGSLFHAVYRLKMKNERGASPAKKTKSVFALGTMWNQIFAVCVWLWCSNIIPIFSSKIFIHAFSVGLWRNCAHIQSDYQNTGRIFKNNCIFAVIYQHARC